MIDNLIFKKIEKRVSNGLKFINYDASLTKKEFNKSLSENEDILEIDQKIADCNADIEKYEKRIIDKFNEISKEVFFGDDIRLRLKFKKYLGDIKFNECFYETPVVDLNYVFFEFESFTSNNFRLYIYDYCLECILFKKVKDIEFFLKTISEIVKIDVLVKVAKEELEKCIKDTTRLKDIAESGLKKYQNILSICEKMKVKNEKLIKKVNKKIEEYSSVCESYFKFMSTASTIEDKLNNEVEAFNEMVKIKDSTDFTLYKNAIKVKESYLNHKENLIENFKANSKELGHISKIRSEENIKELVKNSVSEEELRALKRDPNFMFELGKANKSKIENRATKLLVNYLSEKLVPQEQTMSK